MDARITHVGWDDRRDTGFVEVWLSGVDRNALGTIRLAFASFTQASREQARLADLERPSGEEQLAYRRAADRVAGHLQSLGTLLLPVAKALAEQPVTDEEQAEADPTGFVPGKGDAYDYLPEWMAVPGLRQTEGQDDPPAVVKLFTPDSSWTWYVVESDGDTCFGLVAGMETELGYFSLSEMREATGPLGLRIERDLWFRPAPVTQLAEYRAKWGDDGPYAGSRQVEEGRKPEAPIRDEDYVPLPEGWTVEDVRFLLEKLKEGPVLVADTELGIPTIHDVKGQVEHCGLGLMKATAREFTVTFDAGGAMQRTPSGRSWSFLKVTAGEYPYDTEGVRVTLQHYIDCAAAEPAEAGKEAPARDEAAVAIKEEMQPDRNPAETLAVGPVDTPERVAEAEAVPQPWQLTRRQYQERKAVRVAGGVPVLNAADADEHRQLVEEALGRGESVPTHAFEDYPDLWRPWAWTLERWLQMEHTIQRTGPDMRYVAPTGDKTLWPGTTSREEVKRQQHRHEVKQAIRGGEHVPGYVLADYPDLEAGEVERVPLGALRVTYLAGVPDGMVWSADVDSYQERGGAEALARAFGFVADLKRQVEAWGYRVHAISKAFDSDTHAVVSGDGSRRAGDAPQAGWGGETITLPRWGDVQLTLAPVPRDEGLPSLLDQAVCQCYAEPCVPPHWTVPGLHLARHVRGLLLRAYGVLEEAGGGPVLWDDLWHEFDELAREDDLLGRLERVRLWSSERWVESLGYEVVRPAPPKSWEYVPPDGRRGRLAEKHEGDVAALMEALARSPNATRTSCILSALADAGAAIPDGYASPEQAGAPERGPQPDTDGGTRWQVGGLDGRIGAFLGYDADGNARLRFEDGTEEAFSPHQLFPVVEQQQPGDEAGAGEDEAGEGKRQESRNEAQLPDGIPAIIEVDGGRAKGWLRAEALRVTSGKWLHYRLLDGDAQTGRVQVIGRDIVWRPVAAA